jgi:predicted dehydrogenase
MKKPKILVVGAGLMGVQHISRIKDNKNCELAAIVAPNITANQLVAKNNQIQLHTSLEIFLNKEQVDGVIIASPNQFHAQQARLCIETGIPVLIEKPITSSIEDGIELVKFIKQKKAKVLIGHHRIYSPLMIESKRIIQSGRLGRLVSVIGSAQFYKPDNYFLEGPWRKELGGGPILINLIHEIGNLRMLCGEIKAVQAISSSVIRNFSVEDSVAINFQFENGMLGSFMLSDSAASSQSWEHTSMENPNYPYCNDQDCYFIAGTLGSLNIPTMRVKSFQKDLAPSWLNTFKQEKINIDRTDPLESQLKHFLEVINGNANPIVSAFDGLRNLEVAKAIRDSAKENRLININNLN